MLIATACLGDTLATLTKMRSLDKEDPIPVWYELHFTDLPTSKRWEITVPGENDAVCLFAAWLTADEEDGSHAVYRDRLYSTMPEDCRKVFLP